jgi:hypothetical protein
MDHAKDTEVLDVKAGDELQIAHQNGHPWSWSDQWEQVSYGAEWQQVGNQLLMGPSIFSIQVPWSSTSPGFLMIRILANTTVMAIGSRSIRAA